ncbi:FkbM family methyltransferase [Stygiolobus sp. CP8521M]|uniref:FkbM family methyltransferase n=1 Tax=Stygiolobus sp. CP8521M TaxID=3133136 RepID=UPI00307CEB63
MFKRNIKLNNFSNITLLNYAVSDMEETVYFNTTGGSAKVSGKGIPVKAKPLDYILHELGDPKITIMKMDIEGYEGKVLSAFNNYQYFIQIIVEVHSKELKNYVANLPSFKGFIVVDVSKIRILRVVRNVIRHFVSFLSVERKYNYFTNKQGIK